MRTCVPSAWHRDRHGHSPEEGISALLRLAQGPACVLSTPRSSERPRVAPGTCLMTGRELTAYVAGTHS